MTIAQMQYYVEHYSSGRFGYEQILELCPEEVREVETIRTTILSVMKKADEIASPIQRAVRDRLTRP